ncbi:MAG: T9SS type A sorting domain-containing protein [Chitinophagales bacterium]|nr:T9SS type A sorting domain-containing protein [Chitinophagales bacterium]
MKRSIISTLLLACVCALFSYAQPGSLDIHFWNHSTVKGTISEGNEGVQDFIIQGDGKITTIQSSWDGIIRRYLENGRFDTSFGISGRSIIDLGGCTTTITSIKQQKNGGYIVVGYIKEDNGEKWGFMQRLDSNGIVDSTFLKGGLFFDEGEKKGYVFNGLALLDDGKILALIGNENSYSFIQILPNGTFDNNFGNGGVFHINTEGYKSFRLKTFDFYEASGKIVIRGRARYIPTDNTKHEIWVYEVADDHIKELYGFPNGLLAHLDWDHDDVTTPRILQDGSFFLIHKEEDAYNLVKLRPDGRLDESFGDKGRRLIPIDSDKPIATFVIHESGNIFIAGTTTLSASTDEQVAYIAQLDEYGDLVTAFGEGGFSFFDYYFNVFSWSGHVSLEGLCLQSNGKIYMLGRYSGAPGGHFIDIERIARFNPGVLPVGDEIVKDTFVAIIYPNPAIESAELSYKLEYAQNVSISLFDNRGRMLQPIINNEWQQEGEHKHVIDVSGLPAGAYRLHCKLGSQIKLLSLVVY